MSRPDRMAVPPDAHFAPAASGISFTRDILPFWLPPPLHTYEVCFTSLSFRAPSSLSSRPVWMAVPPCGHLIPGGSGTSRTGAFLPLMPFCPSTPGTFEGEERAVSARTRPATTDRRPPHCWYIRIRSWMADSRDTSHRDPFAYQRPRRELRLSYQSQAATARRLNACWTEAAGRWVTSPVLRLSGSQTRASRGGAPADLREALVSPLERVQVGGVV